MTPMSDAEYASRRDRYAEIVRTSRIEVINVYRIEPATPNGELVMFTSQYPNSEPTHRCAYVRDGHTAWSMILD